MKLRSYLLLFLFAIGLTNCKKVDNIPTSQCQPPSSLVAQGSCESGYPGVLLVSTGYEATDRTQFIYSVYPQKDTLASDLTVKGWANASNDRIIIPETIISNAPKFVARVSVNCNGKDVFSTYFTFIKRPASSPGCFQWVLQKQ